MFDSSCILGDGSHPVWGHGADVPVQEVPEPHEKDTHLYEYSDKIE
jgi:hypothetical protein